MTPTTGPEGQHGRRDGLPVSRRGMLAGGGAVVGLVATGCDALSTNPASEGGSAKGSGHTPNEANGKQAPMLAKRVKAGKLPPVKERLPDDPLVVQPADRIGGYGGDWNLATLGPSDAWMERVVGYETFTRWTPDFDDVIPNLVTSIEPAKGGREYVLKLRTGVKWSDGHPLTAEDFVWAYNEVLLNTDLYPVAPDVFVVDDKPAEADSTGDNTLRFTFSKPNSTFVQDLATLYSKYIMHYPPHYSKKFHKKYNPDVDKVAKKEGYPDWIDLFGAKHDPWNCKELPRLHAWLPLSVYGEGSRLVYERNPYYWKVDPEGSQLPYVDRLIFKVIGNPETMVLSASRGEIDMQDRTINTLQNKPVLARNRDKGHYDFFDEKPSNMNTCIIALNLTHKDKVKREIFQNRNFRIGLSHAINRDEIVNTVYQKQGEPYQVAPRPNSPFHDPEMAKQFTEFDPDKANHYLDRAGFTERDGGIRLGPDGKRISFNVEVPSAFRPEWPEVLEMVHKYWRAVGIDAHVKNEDRSLFDERTGAGMHDAAVWQGEGGGWVEPLLRTDWYFPSQHESGNYAFGWMTWYQTGGKSGDRPPEPVRRQMQLYQQVKETMNKGKRKDLMQQLLTIAKEFYFCIGTVLPPESYGIVKNDFHNVPKEIPQSFLYPTPGPSNPEQYFISEG